MCAPQNRGRVWVELRNAPTRLGLDEYPYKIFHNKCELYFIILFGAKLLG